MGETVGYYIEVKGFRDDKEKEEFKNLAKNFQNAKIYEYTDGVVSVEAPYGWRRDGLTCRDMLIEHFGGWLNKHPHIVFDAVVEYLERCPKEKIKIGGKVEIVGVVD